MNCNDIVRFNGNLQAKEAMLESHYYPARKGFAGFSRDSGLAEWNLGNRNHREREGKGKRKHTVVKRKKVQYSLYGSLFITFLCILDTFLTTVRGSLISVKAFFVAVECLFILCCSSAAQLSIYHP